MDRVDDMAGVVQLDPRAHAVRAPGPARVDEPGADFVPPHPSRQKLGVTRGMKHHERRAEAGRERGLRLLDSHFGARDLGRVSAQEVVHRLGQTEPADRRQHAEGVTREKDDVSRMPRHAGDLGMVDKLDRVARARVLGDRAVPVIGLTRLGVEHHVFEHRAEPDRPVDLRLFLLAQVDALGVATSLDIEHPFISPAVFVVADQLAPGIGRQSGLAGSRQAEEERHIAAGRLIGATVHRQDAASWASSNSSP